MPEICCRACCTKWQTGRRAAAHPALGAMRERGEKLNELGDKSQQQPKARDSISGLWLSRGSSGSLGLRTSDERVAWARLLSPWADLALGPEWRGGSGSG